MNKACFIDRDGTLNKLIFDSNRGIYRAPWSISEFELLPDVIESLKRLNKEYTLFLITNQPDGATGLVTLQKLFEIKYHFINMMILNKIHFKEHYYCFHSSADKCKCKKPKPYFLLKAGEDYHIDLAKSWIIGDRDVDIECGQNAGTKTIRIQNGLYDNLSVVPTFKVRNIKEACDIILKR